MPGPESWVTQSCLSQYIPSLPFDLVSFYLVVIYKRQVKLWCWASSRRKTIVNRNKVIEHFSKFLFLPSPFGCMLFVLNSVFHWVFLSLMINYQIIWCNSVKQLIMWAGKVKNYIHSNSDLGLWPNDSKIKGFFLFHRGIMR